MGLSSIASSSSAKKTRGEEVVEGKGKERDDDSHYFESYAYNGQSLFKRREEKANLISRNSRDHAQG